MKWKLSTLLFINTAIFSANAISYPCLTLPKGWYLEANYGETRASHKDYPTVYTDDNTGPGWSGAAGYKFMPYFGVEGGYTRYAPNRLKSPDKTVAKDNHYAVDIAAKGFFPLASTGLELFGKLGVAKIYSDIGVTDAANAAAYGMTFNTRDQSSTGLYTGGGVDYSFSPSWAVNAQWEKAFGNDTTGNLELLSFGITFILDPAVV